MSKNCCCTGHRPKGFPYRYGIDTKKHSAYLQALLQKIKIAINRYGITDFISGIALGVDLDFAETVLKLRNKYHIALECAVCCPNQTAKWHDFDISRYNYILKRADSITLVSKSYSRDCMLRETDIW